MKKTYHFIGIGGIGMGSLASLILDKGFGVTGSDLHLNDMVTLLKARGAKISIGHSPENINGADFIVYSSAIKEDNPEMTTARERGIPFLGRGELLARLVNEKTGITVAGAHGKTTCSSMIFHCLSFAGLKPTAAIGGMVQGINLSARSDEGDYFVAEVDESDGSFLYFHPQYSVVTNIDKEHMDHYGDFEAVKDAYRRFIAQTEKDGCLIVSGDDPGLGEIVSKAPCRTLTFGIDGDNDFSARNIRYDKVRSLFDCYRGEMKIGEIELAVPGRHNILNALSCIALAVTLGVDFSVIRQSLRTFKGVKRRMELKGVSHEITVMDDYAHHPTEIRAVLETARHLKSKRVVTVFQPHRYSRLRNLFDDFVEALPATDVLIVTDIYAASEENPDGLSAESLVEAIKGKGFSGATYVPKEHLLKAVLETVAPGDLVLTLGAGDITKFSDELLQEIHGRL